mmetsp:Transcript_19311/g.53709  ORF Transcript_19311/g.53709 Transcript_19311/m.53709 type:complete len:373 (+) Transcript_19311:111-1229(+)
MLLLKFAGTAVSVRIVGLPTPDIFAHLIKGPLGLPPHFVRGQTGIRIADGNIPRTALAQLVLELMPAGLLHGLEQSKDADAVPRAEVVGVESAGLFLGMLDGLDVTFDEIHDVKVISDARAVGSGVIVAEDGEEFAPAAGDLREVGHEVVRDAVGVLPDEAGFVGADGVEVPQEDDGPVGGLALERFRVVKVLEDLLDEVLGASVGVGDVLACWELLRDWHGLWFAVDGCRRGEDDAAAAELIQELEEDEGAVEVVVVVEKGHAGAVANGLETSEVDAGCEGRRCLHDLPELRPVAHIDVVEDDALAAFLLRYLAYLRHPVEGCVRGVGKVVNHHHVVVLIQQRCQRMTADVPATSGHQDRLSILQCHRALL